MSDRPLSAVQRVRQKYLAATDEINLPSQPAPLNIKLWWKSSTPPNAVSIDNRPPWTWSNIRPSTQELPWISPPPANKALTNLAPIQTRKPMPLKGKPDNKTSQGSSLRTYIISADVHTSYSMDDNTFFIGSVHGDIFRHTLDGGTLFSTLKGHTSSVRCMYVSKTDDDNMYSASNDGTVYQWDLSTAQGKIIGRYNNPLETILENKSKVFAGSSDGNILMCGESQVQKAMSLHVGAIKGLAINGDGNMFSCSLDGLAKCMDISTSQLRTVYEGDGPLRSLCYCEEMGQIKGLLVCGGSSGKVLLYNSATARCELILEGHSDAVLALCSIPPYRLLSAGDDKQILQWDLRRTQYPQHIYKGHTDSVIYLDRLSESQNKFLSGSLDRSARIWEIYDPVPSDPSIISSRLDRRLSVHTDYLALIKKAFVKYARGVARDGSRVLTPPMFSECMKFLGISNINIIDLLFHQFDSSHDGQIQPSEVLDTLHRFMDTNQENTFKECFEIFEPDQGEISAVALGVTLSRGQRTMERLGVTTAMINEMIDLCKYKAGGTIDFQEFTTYMLTEPTLVRAMFPVVIANYARKVGASWDIDEKDKATLEKNYSLSRIPNLSRDRSKSRRKSVLKKAETPSA